MADKIFLNARYAFRSDTLNNWQNANPTLEKGEPAVVTDGIDGEWLKIGDGVTPFNSLEWKKGPKGEQGIQGIQGDKGDTGEKGDTGPRGEKGDKGDKGDAYILTDTDKQDIADMVENTMADQSYNSESENAQSGIAVAEALTLFDQSKQKNYEHIATITVAPDEDGTLPTSIVFSADAQGEAFQLTDFYIRSVLGADDGSSAKASFYVNGCAVFGTYSFGSTLSATSLRTWYLQWINLGENNGALCVTPAITNSGTTMPTISTHNTNSINGGLVLPSFTRYFPVKKFEIKLTGGTAKTFIEGSKFELWGVRK